MLRNYLKIAYRNLVRQKGYAAINIFGLAVGLAACVLIALFVLDELSYDRFHEHEDRIYRVLQQGERLSTSPLLGPTMEEELPEIEKAVRLSRRYGDEVLVTREQTSVYERGFLFTDPSFFDVFSFPLLRGNPETALEAPFSVVITESMAQKYFPDQDPVGRTLNIEGSWDAHDYTVTGVIQDPPHNSHLSFTILASFSTRFEVEPSPDQILDWRHVGDYTYVLLDEQNDLEALQAKIPAFFRTHHPAWERLSERPEDEQPDLAEAYAFQPVTSIHLYSDLDNELAPGGDVRYLYVFSVVALLILLIACINYTTLATARSASRAREVGVRKVVGASRASLVRQFLGESALVTLMAVLGAGLLAKLSLPVFNQLTGKEVSLAFGAAPWFWPALLLGGLAISLIAGLYPALVLSGFQPTRILRGLASGKSSKVGFRNGLVTLQFAISIVLIAATLTVQYQLNYMQNKRLGLDPEQVITLSTRGQLGSVGQHFGAFKEELLRHSAITQVSAVNPALPAYSDDLGTLHAEDPREASEDEDQGDELQANRLTIGMDFLETLDISLVQGRNIRPGDFELIGGDEYTPVLINETAADQFGWDEPIGKEFSCCLRPTPRVVGVVEDFHYQSLKEDIAPLALIPSWWSRHVLVRAQTDDLPSTIDHIEAQWQEVLPEYPFAYTFLDDRFAEIYDAEERLAQVFGLFALLAIVIACLGLFGLVAFTAQQRTKEIGIRKVLGATATSIVALLSKDFLKLVGFAFLLATPVAYYAMSRWLEDFAYRIELGAGVFLLAGAAALLIALATVSYQALRAAWMNPTEAIRNE